MAILDQCHFCFPPKIVKTEEELYEHLVVHHKFCPGKVGRTVEEWRQRCPGIAVCPSVPQFKCPDVNCHPMTECNEIEPIYDELALFWHLRRNPHEITEAAATAELLKQGGLIQMWCPYCPQNTQGAFTGISGLRAHLELGHQLARGSLWVAGRERDRVRRTRDSLAEMKKMASQRTRLCYFCGSDTRYSQEELSSHLLLHHQIPGEFFRNKVLSYYADPRGWLQKLFALEMRDIADEELANEIIACPLCPKSQRGFRSMRAHFRKSHAITPQLARSFAIEEMGRLYGFSHPHLFCAPGDKDVAAEVVETHYTMRVFDPEKPNEVEQFEDYRCAQMEYEKGFLASNAQRKKRCKRSSARASSRACPTPVEADSYASGSQGDEGLPCASGNNNLPAQASSSVASSSLGLSEPRKHQQPTPTPPRRHGDGDARNYGDISLAETTSSMAGEERKSLETPDTSQPPNIWQIPPPTYTERKIPAVAPILQNIEVKEESLFGGEDYQLPQLPQYLLGGPIPNEGDALFLFDQNY